MKLRHMKQLDPEEHIASARSAFSRKGNVIASILFEMLCVLFFLPVLLVLIVSFSSESSVTQIGYSFFPQSLSLEAWRYLLHTGNYLIRAFLNSVLITAAGTLLGLILMCPIAYALSRKRFRLRRGILIFLMIPMLFSGGLVSTYMVNTQIFHLQNTYLALILPGLCSTWYIMILRNYFQTALSDSLIEAAMPDGASFLQRVRYITLPMLRPTIAMIFILRLGSILASDFGLFYQVPMNSNSLQTVTQTLDVYVYKALMLQANFSYSAAASFLQNLVGCALLLLANAIIRRIDEDSAL